MLAVGDADSLINQTVDAESLNPQDCFANWDSYDLTVLNYHRALHSRWTLDRVKALKELSKVVVVMHDTFGENPPDQLSQDLCKEASAFIVHEPCVGLEGAIYWRMGVPEFNGLDAAVSLQHFQRPILGTIGFNFPWKNWNELAKITKRTGWGFLICCPEMSHEDEQSLRDLNPWLDIRRDLSTSDAISVLHTCDATAFTNVCGNSGQSAAILMGIAARKPVIALSTCRQYRGIYQDPLGKRTIRWAESFEEVEAHLTVLDIGSRFDTGIVALAEQESWQGLGQKYSALYRSLVA